MDSLIFTWFEEPAESTDGVWLPDTGIHYLRVEISRRRF
jgi:hypothetical protein